MADFNVDLQQPKGAGVAVMAPVAPLPKTYDTTWLSMGTEIVSGLLKGKKEADEEKQKQFKNQVISDFAREQTFLNQAMTQGGMSKVEAADRARANMSKYVGSYAEFAEDFAKINKGLFEYSELGVAKSEEDIQRDLRKQLLSDAQKDGMLITPSMSQATIDAQLATYQQIRAAESDFKRQSAVAAEQRSMSQEQRASFQFEYKQQAANKLVQLGASQIGNAQSFIMDMSNAVRAGKSRQDAEAEVNLYFANIEGALAATAALEPELAGQWRGLFDKMKTVALSAADGTSDIKAMENQLKEIQTRSKLMAMGDPEMRGLYATTSLLNGSLTSLSEKLNASALRVMTLVASGNAPKNLSIVGDKAAEQATLTILPETIRNLQKEGAAKANPEEVARVGNNILKGLEQLSFETTPVNPKDISNVVSLLAKPEWAYLVKNGLIDQSQNTKAKQAFQVIYQNQVANGIVDKLRSEFKTTGGASLHMTNLVDITWNGSGVAFAPKQTGYMSPVDRQDQAQYIRELNSANKALNQLIHVGAHMEGTTDYAGYWENNKHLMLPGMYIQKGTRDGEYEYTGEGFVNDPNSWKKVGSSNNNSSLERQPYPSEDAYFKENPQVAGMAAEDDKVIINPYSPLSEKEKDAVRVNETARIFMRNNLKPDFELTPEQDKFLETTTYKNASPEERKSTIAARILSGDPSAGKPSKEQLAFIEKLKKAMRGQ